MTMFLVSSVCVLPSVVLHLDLAGSDDAPGALKGLDLVLLEQKLDALHVGLDILLLEFEQGRQLDARLADLDAHLREARAGFFVELRRVQQRLRRDAADIEAGPAEGGVFLDHGGFQTELRRPNGADIAAGTGTNDDEIVGHDNHLLIVIAGLVPAIPSDPASGANLNEMAGTGPAMTDKNHKSSTSRAGSSRDSFTRTRKVTASRPSTMR